MIKRIYEKNQKLITYAFFGGMGVLSDVGVYSLFIFAGINYQFANASGYLVGTLLSFFLNRHYTFKVKDKVIQRLLTFLLVAFIGYLSSAFLLYVLVEYLGIDAILAKVLTLFFVLIIQFTLNKKITFKSDND